MHIGFDDTDSPGGMCTTYLGFRLAGALRDMGARFLDYPRLVRFNPNIPWKTRGNGAVGLKISTDNPGAVKKKAARMVRENSQVNDGANPAVVFYESGDVPESITEFSRAALWRLIGRSQAKRFVRQNNLESFYFGNGQGLVGAVGVIGYEFGDATLELLRYRKKEKFGTPRKISADSVRRMQEATYPGTFGSYDEKKRRVMIAPHGPDPVLYGIRGDDPAVLLRASKMIRCAERPGGYMLFKSNQGTSDHLRNGLDAKDLRPYASGTLEGTIQSRPVTERGGHVFFSLRCSGGAVRCAVYKESGMARHIAELNAGDRVRVGGGVRKASKRHPRVLNVEFVDVTGLVRGRRMANPLCAGCKKRMKSRGSGQGFACAQCGAQGASKIAEAVERKIKAKTYMPVISAQRHLTRPRQRIKKRNEAPFGGSVRWFSVR